MSVIINSNFAARHAANNLAASNDSLQKSLNRLSSGSRIVNPSDDAGGLAVSMKMTAAVKRQGAVKTNLANTTSFLQTQDGALKVAGKVLDRISELKVLFSDETKTASDRANYDTEYQELKAELTAIGAEKFNGIDLFGSSSMSVPLTEQGASGTDLSVGGVNLLGSGSGSGGSGNVLLSDSFAGSSIDNTKWTVQTPYGDSSVTEGGGVLNSTNRGVLVSNQSLTAPYEVSGSVQLAGTQGWSNAYIQLRANASGGAYNSGNGVLLQFRTYNSPGGVYVNIEQNGGPSPFTTTNNYTGSVATGQWFDFRITDDGNTISAYINGASQPQIVAQTTYAPGDKLVLMTRESLGGLTGAANFKNLQVTSLNSGASGGGSSNSSISTVANTDSLANISLATITEAIGDGATYRAQNGAQQSRLEFASEMLTVNQANLEQANSRITDVDVAEESTQLARFKILVQAGTAMLSQANQSSQTALKLLAA